MTAAVAWLIEAVQGRRNLVEMRAYVIRL